MSLSEIAAFVESQRARVHRARTDGRELARLRIEQEIAHSLGVVTVDAWGDLCEVRLNRAGLRVADRYRMGEHILYAIRAAEVRAAALIEDYVNQWRSR